MIMGGLDLAIFRVLRVRQNSHLGTLEYSGINQAIQNISAHAGSDPPSFLEQVTWLFCLHHLERRSTPAYASTDVPVHLISVLPVRSGRSKENS